MRSKKTLAELQAWIEQWWDAPDAQALADFLGIELAPEPAPAAPVGQRRRSPGGIDVIFGGETWLVYAARHDGGLVGKSIPTYSVAGWEVITDAPEVPEDVIEAAAVRLASDECPHDDDCDGSCMSAGDRAARILAEAGLLVGTLPESPECDREHLPDGHVPITFNGWSDDDLRVSARVVGSGGFGAAIRAELTNRGASS